jgi:two-component system NtrC family sensor kinase
MYIGPEQLRPALLAALMSVSLLVALFAYLNCYTRRRYFSLWMVAWMFYALWLMLTYRLESSPSPFLQMTKNWSVGISAVFLFWGSLMFMAQRVTQRLLGLVILFLLVWSYVGSYHIESPLQATIPIFGMMGVASIASARCFLVYRKRKPFAGAGLLAAGFALWGAFLISYPFMEEFAELGGTIFVLAAMLQLFIAVSMIILVLEEARTLRATALDRAASERAARRGLENRIRSTEARYRQLFDQASEAIVVTAQAGFAILDLNARARRLLGITDEAAPGLALTSFIERSTTPRAGETQRLDRLLPGAPLSLVSRDGTRSAVVVERTAIEIDGQPAFQFVFKEFNERCRLEQQVRQAEKLSALGQMISGIAHELNNPLAVIKGYVDLILSRNDLSERNRGDLSKVCAESNRAAKLVRSFLSFAREQPPQRVAVDLNRLVENVVELRHFDSLVAQTRFVLKLSSGPVCVKADADQIQQVLVNLINNALHAILGSGRSGEILIRTQTGTDFITLCVEDNGPGVSVELQTKIFEPFFTTKETGSGTGLGLSIAHSIMTEHGGRIHCAGSSLGGAAFTLEFPMSAGEELPPPDTDVIEPSFVAGRTGRILVLDDEPALADMVGQMLTCFGHEVVTISAPLQAIEKVRGEHFDAIVSDFRMPLMDGSEFHGEVRKVNPDLANRIIFLTGDVLSEETKAFFASVGNQRLTKPFQLENVARAVNDILLSRAA